MKPRRTEKQKEIVKLIVDAFHAGQPLSISELHDRLSYTCTFGALRLSVTNLEKKGLLSKQPDGLSKRLVPTKATYDWFRFF